MRRFWVRTIGGAILATSLSACATVPFDPSGSGPAGDGLRIDFEDTLTPSAYAFDGPARVSADPTPGFWAAAPGLARPERARIEHAGTGAAIEVALYGGSGGTVLLSGAAAEALGIGAAPVRIRVTALRRQPVLADP